MIHRWAIWRLEDLDGKRPSFATFYNFTTHLYIHIKNTLCILPAFRTKWISELTSWSSCFRRHGQDREALSSTCNWPFSLLGSRSLVHTGAAENSHRSQLGCWNGMDGLDLRVETGLWLKQIAILMRTMINQWILGSCGYTIFTPRSWQNIPSFAGEAASSSALHRHHLVDFPEKRHTKMTTFHDDRLLDIELRHFPTHAKRCLDVFALASKVVGSIDWQPTTKLWAFAIIMLSQISPVLLTWYIDYGNRRKTMPHRKWFTVCSM